MLKLLFFLALLGLNFLYASEVWQLKNVRGNSAVFSGGKVTQSDPDGEFELAGTRGFKVKGGVDYIFDFQCKVEKIDNAYVNFYLRGVDQNGNVRQMIALGASPGPRGLNRDRMSRLEVRSDSFLNHRLRFKAGKKVVKIYPVYESSDGQIVLVPGKMELSEKLNRPSTVATITVAKAAAAKNGILWRSFKLMPEVEYALESNCAIPAGCCELQFIADSGKLIAAVPLKGKITRFKLPEDAVETVLIAKGKGVPFSAVIKKDFKVDFQRGVYANEWQGTELNRGNAKGKAVAFRRKFTIDSRPDYAAIRFLGHNRAELFVNGKSCGSGEQFFPGRCEITGLLQPGENVIAIVCNNRNGVMRVLFDAYIRETSGKEQLIVSDQRTRYSLKMPQGRWMLPGFDDSSWLPAVTGGSPKDFGDSIIATRINNRHERLYIGPYTDHPGVTAVVPAAAAIGRSLDLTVKGVKNPIPTEGRLIFRKDGRSYETLLSGKDGRYQATPRYLPAGKYQVFLNFDRQTFNGKKELEAGFITLTAPEKIRLPQFEVRKSNGKSLLCRDGKLIPAAVYCHGQRLSIEVKRSNDAAGIKIHMFWIEDMERQADGSFDLTPAENALRHTIAQLAHDPEAHVLVCISFRPPKKFAKRPKYQRELTVTSKGDKLRISHSPGERKYGKPYKNFDDAAKKGFSSVSHASQLKIREYCDAVKAIVRHFENSPFAAKIAGYGFSGEMDGQWHLYAPYSGSGAALGMVDYSPVMLDFFRRYLRKKYGNDAALQNAWQQPDVTIDSAMIPGYEERVGNNFFVSRPAADYAEAFALAEAELISALSKAAKEELKRKALVWIYTKDSYRDVGLNQFLPHVLNSGSGFEQYTSPYFDACGNPTDYYFRQNGLHPANRGCHASAHLNSKIKLLEMDLRSYLTQAQQKVWGGDDLNATLNHFRNVLMEGFQYGSPFRFYSFWLGWYNNDAILKTIKRMGEIEQAQLTLPIRWKKRVCHFYDDRAITHIGNFDDKGNRLRFYYFAKSLTGIGANTLNRSGVGFDTYYLRDLLNPEFPADQYDVFIFNSCFSFDQEMLNALNAKLRKPGKVLIFPWGSGFLNEKHQVDPAAVEKLTGIKTAPHSVNPLDARITVNPAAHPLLAAMKKQSIIGARQRYNVLPQLPMFKVNDPQAAVAGHFGDGAPALAVKEVNGSHSIVMFTPDFSAELLRSVCKARNIHIYAENGSDFIMTDGNFLGIHSAAGGRKRIPLPEKVKRAVDHFTGEIVASESNELEIMLKDDQTRIFRLEF